MIRHIYIIFIISVVMRAGPIQGMEQGKVDVTILSSRINQSAFLKTDIDYRKGIRLWCKVSGLAGLTYRIGGDYELGNQPQKSHVYVLHFVERLTEAQRANIEKLREEGVSIILVGMVGMFDQDGEAQQSLAEKWFGLDNVKSYAPKDNAYFVSRAGNVFALGNAPGFRFEYEWTGRYFLAGTQWSTGINVDWSLNPFPDKAEPSNNSMMAMRVMGQSRIAWFGINPESVVDAPDQQQFILSSLTNLLKWAARKPVVAACHWPDCRTGAAVVTADVESSFETGADIASACSREKVKGSFFLVGNLAKKHPDVVTALAKNGEIGSHSMKHESFKGRTFDDQLSELMEGKVTLEQLGVKKVIGFRPPKEEYDDATLKGVAAAGYGFIYGNLVYDRAYPATLQAGGRRLYQFARIVADDYNILVGHNVKDSLAYVREYTKEFYKLFDMGGLFPFSFHTNFMALPETVDSLGTVIKLLKKEDIWVTTFGEIIQWMEVRKAVSVSAGQDKYTTIMKASNKSSKPIRSFSINFHPPWDSESKIMEITAPANEILVVRQAARQGLVVRLDLAPGETKEIKMK